MRVKEKHVLYTGKRETCQFDLHLAIKSSCVCGNQNVASSTSSPLTPTTTFRIEYRPTSLHTQLHSFFLFLLSWPSAGLHSVLCLMRTDSLSLIRPYITIFLACTLHLTCNWQSVFLTSIRANQGQSKPIRANDSQ